MDFRLHWAICIVATYTFYFVIFNWSIISKRDFHIHIGIAPTKNIERIEWFLEKCTEIGIDEISFLQCQRSERKQVNMERVEKVVISAMKQSGKAWLPILHPLTSYPTVIQNTDSNQQLFVAHLADDNRVELKDNVQAKGKYFILIGPEGDFTPEEISQALDKGFKPVMLGQSRLRTETAGIVACHTFQLMN